MYEKEEHMLRSYFRDAEASRTEVSDDALEAAIQEGLRRGKHAKRSRTRYIRAAILAGAAAAVFLLMWGGSLQLPGPKNQLASEQANSGPYPPLKGHNLQGDITLNTANNHGLIQPVGKSVTQGDYTITVDGILVGSQQLKVFYTLENRSKQKAIILGTALEKDGRYSVYGQVSGGHDMGLEIQRLQADFTFPEELNPSSKDINIVFRVGPDSANARYEHEAEIEGEEKLKVGIKLDLDTYQKFTRTVPLNEEVEISGQRIQLQKIVISPAGMILKASVEPDNTLKVSGLWEPYLESVKDGQSTKLNYTSSFMPDENGELTYFFDSNALDQPDSISLRASGMFAVDPAKLKVVVDTKQKAVLSSPDELIKFGSYTNSKEGQILTLEYEESNERHYGYVDFSEEFTDGEGNKHKLDDSSKGVRSTKTSTDTGGLKATEYLYLKPEEYPQPLTFTLRSYPGVIEKPIAVPFVAQGEDIKHWDSAVLDNIPKPEGAKEAGIIESDNPNIRMGVKYELENIGGEQGLYPPMEYFEQLEADGWSEVEDKRLGHMHFFEKEGSVSAIEVREDFIVIYEMEEGSTSY
ncbi:DUF4179 domain-containing protein [Paenibacillus dakarensis]|uniref:DUF4179 domain-containing protein n=1 Tax=Paenibacillus dakarensis TaxID=1527293 RepID=UPI0006D5419B|nr:DUF4179 domain-containing protein [Paenibacillus dakarensis]